MNTRSIIYSLREHNGKTILSIDLTGKLVENNHQLFLELPTGKHTLNKYDYLNKDRIFDDGKHFMYICSKAVDRDYIFEKLLHYAVNKLNTRISYLETYRERLRHELNDVKVKQMKKGKSFIAA